MKMKLLSVLALGASVFAIAPASANVIHLNFAGLDGVNEEGVLNYYDGGFGSLGSGPGPNYGIVFSSNSITCADHSIASQCNTAMIPGGPGANALFFVNGGADTMDVAAGFKNGLSFFYSSPFDTGSVSVFSGLDGTGTLLATINLPSTTDGSGTSGCEGTNYCPYAPVGVGFAGVAESVEFSGVNNFIAFADITFGSPNPVPEPLTLSLFGAGLIGAAALRRRRKAAKAA